MNILNILLIKKHFKDFQKYVLILLMLLHCCGIFGFYCYDDKNKPAKGRILRLKNPAIVPFAVVETWTVYTAKIENQTSRGDLFLRRLRFGVRGNPFPFIKYNLQFDMDRYGQNKFTAARGNYKGLNLFNAYITVKALQNQNWLYLHGGYFLSAISREFHTSPWACGSFDKSNANWYLRYFLTSKGRGIEPGIGIGGLKKLGNVGASYRIALHNPVKHSGSRCFSPLYSGRVMFSFGEPEQAYYKYMLTGNNFCCRDGMTIGFGSSCQGKTDNGMPLKDSVYFDRSIAYGMDILAEFKGIRLEGECYRMTRKAPGERFTGWEYHGRMGFTMPVAGFHIEPIIMYSRFTGNGAANIYPFNGNDSTADFGINWYVKKDQLMLGIHYLKEEGNLSKEANYPAVKFKMMID